MTKDEIINNLQRMIELSDKNPRGGLVQAREFVKYYIGTESSFAKSLEAISLGNGLNTLQSLTIGVLKGLKDYVENDLLRNVTFVREIQLETVSDYLEQAETLLNDPKVHPAAAAVLIGASLEEFLRQWLEETGFDISTIKNSIDAYTKELKNLDKINKQDLKDIISWAGTRNDAAHGHWANVEDRQRIKLVLEGVNLFIRKYSFV